MTPTPLQNELNKKGREQGPDFILTIDPDAIIVDPPGSSRVSDVISSDSGISEILNIIAFLVNPVNKRVAGTIDPVKSISPNAEGTKHHTREFDVVDDGGNLTSDNSGSLFGAVIVNYPLINLNNFLGHSAGVNQPQIIPHGILTRRGGSSEPGYNFSSGCPPHAARTLTGVAGPVAPDAETTILLSKCVKQMINILIKVRDIFGPQGWTALFSQVKSGGANKNHIKRTHRQHRRRYSSKQY
jgi:hypothetical protein